MKNIISKILDIVALCIRILTIIALTFGVSIFLIYYHLTLLAIGDYIGLHVIPFCILCLITSAFLREKKDTYPPDKNTQVDFICPNEKVCETNCHQPYACDACPYNKENK